MNYNRLCNIEDFAWLKVPINPRRRKAWETAMAVIVLGDVQDKEVLGVGAGTDRTIVEVCERGGRMWATDLYAQPGGWAANAMPRMLFDPEGCFGKQFDARRLVVQHMDARRLRFPGAMFDRVVSLSSIEHFGTDLDIARAANEIGRVMKPGAIAAIVTEYKISGDGQGWPGVRLFDQRELEELIIEPAGLERIDDPLWHLSGPTLVGACALDDVLQKHFAGQPITDDDCVLTHRGYRFTSVMLALRKPE